MIYKPVYLLTVILFLISGCNKVHQKSEIITSMNHYDRLIMKTDADSIAQMYTEDGELGDKASGQDSIKKYLESFKNITVLKQVSVTSLVEFLKDTAFHKGRYTQTVIVSGKDTITLNGTFATRWEWGKEKGWRIKRISTNSSQSDTADKEESNHSQER